MPGPGFSGSGYLSRAQGRRNMLINLCHPLCWCVLFRMDRGAEKSRINVWGLLWQKEVHARV